MKATLGVAAALALVGAVAVVAITAWPGDDDEAAASPARGRFVVECYYSHSAPDDPIVFPGEPGMSHLHDFFGNESVDGNSTIESLQGQDTTCDQKEDLASYWAPALLLDGEQIEPLSSDSYYRAAPGVDPADLVAFPPGFVAIGGDSRSEGPQSTDIVGWGCGRNPRLSPEPPTCGARSPLTVRVIFPDCWDGENLDSADHVSHVAYSSDGRCPDRFPVNVPQLEFVVQYPFSGDPTGLYLASGEVTTAHADFFNAWEPGRLDIEIEQCLGRDVICGTPSI